MTEDHPNADDWRNRAEAAKQRCVELRAEIERLLELIYRCLGREYNPFEPDQTPLFYDLIAATKGS